MSPHAHRDVIGRQARLNGRPPHFRSHSHFCSKQRTTPPSPDQLTSPASPIPTARTSEASYGAQTELSSQPTASVRRSLPNRRQRPRGPASPPPTPNLVQRVRAARLPPQASIWAPSCRPVLGLRTAAVLAGHGNQTSGPRAASRPLSPPAPAGSGGFLLTSGGGGSPHKRDGTRSINGTSCGAPGVSLYSHRKPRPSRDPSAEMRPGTTF